MAKYDPLKDYLQKIPLSSKYITLSFAQINEIIRSELPYSALNYPAWWSNEIDGKHVQAHAWQEAGWKVETVDFPKQRVRFVRSK